MRSSSPAHRPAQFLPRTGLFLLAALTLLWGLNWPFMKLALLEIPPWTFRTLCLFGGGAILLGLTGFWGERAGIRPELVPRLAFVALFNITGWHLFSAYGILNTGSGRAAIIGYTMPLWAAVLSWLVLSVRIGAREFAALGFGMAALVLLVWHELSTLGATPLGALFMSGAAMSWAMGTVLVKRFAPWPMPVTALTAWQQLIGGVPVAIGWLILEPVPDFSALSLTAVLSLLYAVVVAMVFCHTAYFKLLELLPAHVAAISVLAVPVVGVVSSALILGERIGAAEVAALVLVVGALFLLMRPRR